MKPGSRLPDVVERVQRLARSARDFLARPDQIRLAHDPSLALVLDDGTAMSFSPGDAVHEQLADYLGIPLPYYRRMQEQAPDLLAQNANAWLRRSDARRMVRTMSIDGVPTARAVLSDRYRPLDHVDLLDAVLPVLQRAGVTVETCELTERRLYVKGVAHRVQAEVRPGDVVAAGLAIQNSEIGYGALTIQPLVYTLGCTNGMIMADATLRRSHVGRRHEGDGDSLRHLLTDEARVADDRAFFLRVRDVAQAVLHETLFRQQVRRLQDAAGTPIEPRQLERIVEVTASRFGFGDDERAAILSHLVKAGDLSRWGLSSAVTRMSQDVADFDRATELERIGGRLIELPRNDWLALTSMN